MRLIEVAISILRLVMRWAFRYGTYLAFAVILSCSHSQSQVDKSIPDFTFSSPLNRTTVPFQLTDNRILAEVTVNGQGPFVFLFDTGGGNAITPEAAAILNLEVTRSQQVAGAGEKKALAGRTKVNHFQVGDLILRDQDFIVFDLEFLKKAFGFKKLDGAFGSQVLERASVQIDFEHRQLIFGQDLTVPDEWKKLRFDLQDGKPVVESDIEGYAAKVIIDTGDRSSFTLMPKFAGKTKISRRFDSKKEVVSGYGVGGPIRAKWAVLRKICLGNSIVLKNVLTRIPTAKAGGFSDMEVSGSLGNQVLKQFNVLINYRSKQMFLKRNSLYGTPYSFVPPKRVE